MFIKKNRIKTVSKWVGLLIGLFLLVVIGQYTFFRGMSQQNATRIYEIPEHTTMPESSTPGELTIGSFNIAHSRGAVKGTTNWQNRPTSERIAHLKAIAQQLHDARLDVVVLNEIDFSASWSNNINQAEYLAMHAGYKYVVEQRNFDISFPFYTYQFGNAILSKFPIHDVHFFDFPPHSQYEDFFAGNHDGLFVRIDTPFGPVGILAVHLEYRSEAVRVQCVRQIIEWSKFITFPIIAAGDFNSTLNGFPGARHTHSGDNAMSVLFQEGDFTHAPQIASEMKYFTFPSEQPKVIIDWVLGKGAVTIVDSTVIPSALSDHFMVTATVQMNGVKEGGLMKE
jgi:endonuclease/exonuclease/phosphatase family metal-dependent hydrolase